MQAAVGRLLNEDDERNVAQVVVLGASAAEELFPQGGGVGQYVKINHLWLEVVGVLYNPYLGKDEFQGVKIGGDSARLFVPLSTSLKNSVAWRSPAN